MEILVSATLGIITGIAFGVALVALAIIFLSHKRG